MSGDYTVFWDQPTVSISINKCNDYLIIDKLSDALTNLRCLEQLQMFRYHTVHILLDKAGSFIRHPVSKMDNDEGRCGSPWLVKMRRLLLMFIVQLLYQQLIRWLWHLLQQYEIHNATVTNITLTLCNNKENWKPYPIQNAWLLL